ncbi:hypothetical protein BDQ17DRAFT_1355604 [Cyathus striatus]|nr:hypothetical protein BDQ17DRAFT_1355604 [Cyathus striatus]
MRLLKEMLGYPSSSSSPPSSPTEGEIKTFPTISTSTKVGLGERANTLSPSSRPGEERRRKISSRLGMRAIRDALRALRRHHTRPETPPSLTKDWTLVSPGMVSPGSPTSPTRERMRARAPSLALTARLNRSPSQIQTGARRAQRPRAETVSPYSPALLASKVLPRRPSLASVFQKVEGRRRGGSVSASLVGGVSLVGAGGVEGEGRKRSGSLSAPSSERGSFASVRTWSDGRVRSEAIEEVPTPSEEKSIASLFEGGGRKWGGSVSLSVSSPSSSASTSASASASGSGSGSPITNALEEKLQISPFDTVKLVKPKSRTALNQGFFDTVRQRSLPMGALLPVAPAPVINFEKPSPVEPFLRTPEAVRSAAAKEKEREGDEGVDVLGEQKLVMTPKNIGPLLQSAKEVLGQLRKCVEEVRAL